MKQPKHVVTKNSIPTDYLPFDSLYTVEAFIIRNREK